MRNALSCIFTKQFYRERRLYLKNLILKCKSQNMRTNFLDFLDSCIVFGKISFSMKHKFERNVK